MARSKSAASTKPLIYVIDILPRTDPRAKFAKEAFETLVSKFGIHKEELILRLDFFTAFDDEMGRPWSARFKIPRAAARRLARRLRKDAGHIRHAVSSQYRHELPLRDISGAKIPKAEPLTIGQISDLMNSTAKLIEDSLDEVTDRTAGWSLRPKRELTQFVWRKTKKPSDRLLADIISAMLDIDYSEEQQRKFRDRHCHFEGTDSELD
jgi:hypothetical protein